MGRGLDPEDTLELFKALAANSIGFDEDVWGVTEVWLEAPPDSRGEIHIRVEKRKEAQLTCPVCGGRAGVYDRRDRKWRHLDMWEMRTYVRCRLPRTYCEDHGVNDMQAPWEARRHELLACRMEALVIRGCQRSTTHAVAELVGETDSRIWDLLGRAVEQGRASADYSQVTRVGLDETSKAKGQSHVSTMMDLDGRRVIGVADGKGKDVVGELCAQLEEHGGDREAITDVTRDMSGPFSAGVRKCMPNAHQTAALFHVVQLFTKEIDRSRNEERRESDEKYQLPENTKYVWIKGFENLTERQAETRRALDPKRSHLKTARACQMMEGMRDVYQRETKEEAAEALARLCSWMMHSNIPRMKKVARTLRDNWDEILNWWDSRLTNAYLEGSNSLIQSMKRASRGFRNVEYFKTMIFLRMGKLDLPALAWA